MGKVRYKQMPESLAKLTKPDDTYNRLSIGLEQNIGEYYFINVDELMPFKNQARKHFDIQELENLALSITQHGIRQPLTVIACAGQKGKYEVVSGERRLQAAKLAKLAKVPCIILKEQELAEEVAIIENLHRQDLHPVELGMAFSYLLKNETFKTQKELAQKLSIKESTITEHLQFSKLDAKLRQHLIENNICAREKLRKIVKANGDKATIDNILGVKSQGNAKPKKFSIVHISMHGEGLKLQINGLKKLDFQSKQNLRNELLEIIKQLE